MKTLIILTCAIISIQSFAASKASKTTNEDYFNIAYKYKLYHTSYFYLKKAVESPKKKLNLENVYNVLNTISPSLYIYDQQLDSFSKKNTVLSFPVGLRLFFENKTQLSKERLLNINKKNPLYIEANYLLGLINYKKRDFKSAQYHFQQCIKVTTKASSSTTKSDLYLETFKTRCIQQLSRILFEQGDFKQSLKVLDIVKKTDYNWPNLLMDKAWLYYWQDQKPRTIGTILAFNAPILQRYMTPEASYLKALVYFEYCQFNKVEMIYNEFKKLIAAQKNLQAYNGDALLKLISAPSANTSDQFFYYYLKGYKKDIRYYTYTQSLQNLKREIAFLNKYKSLRRTPQLLKDLKEYQRIIEEDFKNFLLHLKEDYISQINKTQEHFVKMSLLVSLNKRKEILDKSTNQNEGRKISLSDMDYDSSHFIWDFRGGFWADEIGDYAIAIEDRCQK